MKYLIFCLTVIACPFPSLSVSASSLDDKVAALKQAMKDEVESDKAKPATQNPFILTRLSGFGAYAGELEAINSNTELPTRAEVESTIENILIAFTSDEVQKAGLALSVEVEKERKAREDAYVAQVQADLKNLREVVAKANKPSDMDSILVDLRKYYNFVAERIGGEAVRQTVAANNAYQFAMAWQNYLADVASGQPGQAMNDLRNLAQTDSGAGILPRSEILKRISLDPFIADAVNREDWLLLKKALTAQSYLDRDSEYNVGAYSTVNPSTGVDSLMTALNQEAADQYALAVVSYENVLKVPNTHIPPKFIGDKLASIQKNHPKEYETGIQIVIPLPGPK